MRVKCPVRRVGLVLMVSLILLVGPLLAQHAAGDKEHTIVTGKTTLSVKNETPYILIVYISGVRVGWIRPYRAGVLKGLRAGYHQLYAHSRWGTTSWGPREVEVPGSWSVYQ